MDISQLSIRQIANALIIYATALPYGADAVKASLMTAAAEASFLRYSNNGESTRPEVWKAYGGREAFRSTIRVSLTFPHDAEAGAAWTTADSVGLFQQRPSMGYGTIPDLMDPAESTRIFLRGSYGGKGKTRYFLQSPTTMTLAQRCQWTEGSETPDGSSYAPMETVADQLIAHFGGLPPEKDGIAMASLDDLAKIVRDNAGTPIGQLAQLVQQIASDVADIKQLVTADENQGRASRNELPVAVWTQNLRSGPARDVFLDIQDMLHKLTDQK